MATSPTRRTPQQQRSKAKVDAILEASNELIVLDGLDTLTTTRVAERSGMAVGTLYQYFEGVDAILDALVLRHAEVFAGQLAEALSHTPFTRKRDAANAGLDEVIRYYEDHPSFRALWRGRSGATGAGFGDAGDVLLGMLIDALEQQDLASRDDPDFLREVEVQWSIAQGLISLAYRRDPHGDPAVLAHLRRLFDLDVLPL